MPKLKQIPSEIPKYKKRTQVKRVKRATHKHQYRTVLLATEFQHQDVLTGKFTTQQVQIPTKVCEVCGRVGALDEKPTLYASTPQDFLFFQNLELSKKALKLPKYFRASFQDKFATEID